MTPSGNVSHSYCIIDIMMPAPAMPVRISTKGRMQQDDASNAAATLAAPGSDAPTVAPGGL